MIQSVSLEINTMLSVLVIESIIEPIKTAMINYKKDSICSFNSNEGSPKRWMLQLMIKFEIP